MAGVKGRSGGKRPGAGRPRKEPSVVPPVEAATQVKPTAADDPLEFLRQVWNGTIDANANQVNAAKAALAYMHRKLGEGGKKEQKQEAASKVAGRFAAAAPPKLVVAGGKRV